MNSTFTLGAGTDGIKPVTETVSVQIGPYQFVIPPGSFTLLKNGVKAGSYTFDGTVSGVALTIQIAPAGVNTYEFKIAAPAILTKPVTITLTIGNDTGTLTL